MDEAIGSAVEQVGQLTQLGVAGLCLAALLFTYLRTIPRLNKALAKRGVEVRALYRAMLTAEQRKAVEEAEQSMASRRGEEG